MMNEEYIYLTEDVGWKEGLNKEKEYKSNPKDVTKLSKYIFLTEKMGWKKAFCCWRLAIMRLSVASNGGYVCSHLLARPRGLFVPNHAIE